MCYDATLVTALDSNGRPVYGSAEVAGAALAEAAEYSRPFCRAYARLATTEAQEHAMGRGICSGRARTAGLTD